MSAMGSRVLINANWYKPTEIAEEALDDVSGGVQIDHNHMQVVGTTTVAVNPVQTPSLNVNPTLTPGIGRAGNWG